MSENTIDAAQPEFVGTAQPHPRSVVAHQRDKPARRPTGPVVLGLLAGLTAGLVVGVLQYQKTVALTDQRHAARDTLASTLAGLNGTKDASWPPPGVTWPPVRATCPPTTRMP
jgi:hypothetical protein